MSSNRFLNTDGVYSTRFFKGGNSKLEINLLKNEVNRVKNNVATNEENINKHQGKIDEIEVKIDSMDKAISANTNDILEVDKTLTQNVTQIEEQLNDHNSRIVTNESSITNNNNEMTLLKKTLSLYNNRIDSLETSDSSFTAELIVVKKSIVNNGNRITALENGSGGSSNGGSVSELKPIEHRCPQENEWIQWEHNLFNPTLEIDPSNEILLGYETQIKNVYAELKNVLNITDYRSFEFYEDNLCEYCDELARIQELYDAYLDGKPINQLYFMIEYMNHIRLNYLDAKAFSDANIRDPVVVCPYIYFYVIPDFIETVFIGNDYEISDLVHSVETKLSRITDGINDSKNKPSLAQYIIDTFGSPY